MKIVSFNVNGLRAVLQKNFIQDFYSFDADIFSLNETKLSEVKDKFNFEPEGRVDLTSAWRTIPSLYLIDVREGVLIAI